MGWEYVIHCHILSHEEMDMMRPESLAVPPIKATWPTTGAAVVTGNGNNRHITLTWSDNSITETAFVVQRSTDGTTWADVGTVTVPLTTPNVHQSRTLTDSTSNATTAYLYRVVAQNTVGYGQGFPTMTASSTSATLGVNAPAAPTTLAATVVAGPQVSLSWRDNATNESGFVIERAVNGGGFTQLATPPARANTGTVTYVDGSVTVGNTYAYRVSAVNVAGQSAASNTATASVVLPGQPTIATATAARSGNNERVTVTWGDVANETSYVVQWSTSSTFATVAGQSGALAANSTTFTTGNIARQSWFFRVRAVNVVGTATSATVTVAPAP